MARVATVMACREVHQDNTSSPALLWSTLARVIEQLALLLINYQRHTTYVASVCRSRNLLLTPVHRYVRQKVAVIKRTPIICCVNGRRSLLPRVLLTYVAPTSVS